MRRPRDQAEARSGPGKAQRHGATDAGRRAGDDDVAAGGLRRNTDHDKRSRVVNRGVESTFRRESGGNAAGARR
jgi:hypothetical protein